MSTHWRATETDGLPEFAAPQDDAGGDLVLAPLPGLPTRWDALDPSGQPIHHADGAVGNGIEVRNGFIEPVPFDQGPFGGPAFREPAFSEPAFSEPAFNDAAFSEPAFGDAAFTEPAFGDAAFAAPALRPGVHPAPLPAPAPAGPAPLAPPRDALLHDVERVCRRLVGIEAVARSIAVDAVGASTDAHHPDGDPSTAMAAAVRSCLAVDLPDERRIPYYQHRARLRRDLARRTDRDRAILAMRHVVGVPPSGVAARLDVPESQVRETASAWCPDDSRVDSLALLRGIDSWISSDLGSAAPGVTGHELAHLDDVI